MPKIKNLFQNFFQAEIVILSIDASFMRLESDPPFITIKRPNMPLAMVLRIADRSVGKTLCDPWVLPDRFVNIFHWSLVLLGWYTSMVNGLIEGFIMVDGNVSTGLGIILYHESSKRYMVDAKELQVIWVPWYVNNVFAESKYVSFPRITGSCS